QQALVNKGKVGHIEKVFDRTRPAGLNGIGSAVDHAKARLTPLWEVRYVISRCTGANPDPVVFLLNLVNGRACSLWRSLLRMRGETYTAALFVIGPTMIRTDKRFALDFTQREFGSTMNAKITPGMCTSINAPEHNIFIQQTRRHRFALGQIRHI